jgi:hypothetical protein
MQIIKSSLYFLDHEKEHNYYSLMRGFQIRIHFFVKKKIRIHLNDIQYSLKNLNYKQIFINTPWSKGKNNYLYWT